MFENFTQTLVQRNIIPAEDSQLYLFGLRQGFYHLVSIASVLVISLILHSLMYTIIFLLAFTPIRTNAGGYHASTQLRCYFLTNISMIVILCVSNYITWTSFMLLPTALLSAIVIFVMAPVEDANKPLEGIEIKVYGRRCRVLVVIELAVMAISMVIGLSLVPKAIAMALLTVAIILVCGKIKLWHSRKI